MTISTWKIIDCLVSGKLEDIGNYAVLILNRPINLPEYFLVRLWNGACFHATADGGTDRWYNFVSTMEEKSKLNPIHPELVSGDFDSVRPETLQLCRENGVNVVCTPDQDKTDFTKALEEIVKHLKFKLDNIIVVVENSGRLDHIMSNLNTLYDENLAPIPLYLLAADSVTWLLKPGSHRIHVPQVLIQAQTSCGLIPLGAPCVASTSGLKWDLDKTKMEYGGLISTCNTYNETCQGLVTIETDSAILWTVNLGFDEH